VARKTTLGFYSCAVVVAIYSWLLLIEAWRAVIVRHATILIERVQWRVVASLKAGNDGRPTNLICSVLFCEYNSL